jgi:excisionase family DNA binding protein
MERFYLVREVAQILKVHEVTLRRWIAEKKVNVIRLESKHIRITELELKRLMNINK